MTPHLRLAQRLAIGVPALLLAGAYVSEYGFGLYPCEMCWWQRYAHFAALAPALVSAFVQPRAPWVALAAVGILASGLIGGFHAGVEYDWWEGITLCAVPPGASGGSAMDAIFATPVIRCDVAPWTLGGVSLAGFNAIFSTLAALAIFALLAKDRRS